MKRTHIHMRHVTQHVKHHPQPITPNVAPAADGHEVAISRGRGRPCAASTAASLVTITSASSFSSLSSVASSGAVSLAPGGHEMIGLGSFSGVRREAWEVA